MKKLVAALSLVALATSASALTDEDWIVKSLGDDPITYTVLPQTVTRVETSDGIETRVVVEFSSASDPNVLRGRLRVSGCRAGTGKVVIARMDSSLIKNATIFDWDRNGERVYDMLAVRGCVAGFEKDKQQSQPQPVKPTKGTGRAA